MTELMTHLMLKIGNEVKFENEVGDIFSGEITEVLSDSYDDVRLRDGEVEYWSKKTKKYVPVKEKSEGRKKWKLLWKNRRCFSFPLLVVVVTFYISYIVSILIPCCYFWATNQK